MDGSHKLGVKDLFFSSSSFVKGSHIILWYNNILEPCSSFSLDLS